MAVRRRLLTGEELLERLRRDDLRPPASLVCAVRAPQRADTIEVSLGAGEGWIDVPVSAVQDAEVLGRRRHGDLSYPLVRLTFRDSDGADSWQLRLLASPSLLPGGGLDRETLGAEGVPNPCQECVRSCMQFVGDAEAFRQCILHCPC